INTLIGLLFIYSAIFFFRIEPGIANAIGYIAGLMVSFSLNSIWTFKEKRPMRKFVNSYILMALIAYLSNLAVVLIGTNEFQANPYLIQLGGISVYTVLMFIGCKWYVFRPEEGHLTDSQKE